MGFSSLNHRKKSPHTSGSPGRLCRLSPVKYYGGLSPFPLFTVARVFPRVCWYSQRLAFNSRPPHAARPLRACRSVPTSAAVRGSVRRPPSLLGSVCGSVSLRVGSAIALSLCRWARSPPVLGAVHQPHPPP